MHLTVCVSMMPSRSAHAPGVASAQNSDVVQHAGEQAVLLPAAEPAIHRAPRRQAVRQHRPRAADPQMPHHRLNNRQQRPRSAPMRRVGAPSPSGLPHGAPEAAWSKSILHPPGKAGPHPCSTKDHMAIKALRRTQAGSQGGASATAAERHLSDPGGAGMPRNKPSVLKSSSTSGQ